jgi:hypothetical protein
MQVALSSQVPPCTLESLSQDVVGHVSRFVADEPFPLFRTSKTISKKAGIILNRNGDLVEELLKYKGVAQQMQAGLFGNSWQASITRLSLQRVFQEKGEGKDQYNGKLLETIGAIFPNLDALHIESFEVKDQWIPHLSKMKNLQDLSCQFERNEKRAIRRLQKQLPGLQITKPLGFYCCRIVYSKEQELQWRVERIEKTFEWTYRYKLSGRMLDTIEPLLTKLPLLELDASCTGEMKDEHLLSIAKIQTLQKIDISKCHLITSAGISYLCRLPNLKEVCIDDTIRSKLSLANTILVRPLQKYLPIPETIRRIGEVVCEIFSYVFSMEFVRWLAVIGSFVAGYYIWKRPFLFQNTARLIRSY